MQLLDFFQPHIRMKKNQPILLFFIVFFYSCNADPKVNTAKENFISHEKEFQKLYGYFKSLLPKDQNQSVWFGLGASNHYYLRVQFENGTPDLGGDGISIDSPEMTSILNHLGWNVRHLDILAKMLSDVNSQSIRVQHGYKTRIIINYDRGRNISVDYSIYDEIIDDSLLKELNHERASNSEFGKRVMIFASSGL
jgi:hypothetical protein